MGSLPLIDLASPIGLLATVDQTIYQLTNLMLLGESQLTWLTGLLSVIAKVGLGLGFVIFIHELGHFLAAKAFGVRCDKFYIGFDVPIKIGPINLPRTLGKFQWGETEYGIGIVPLGGYVKMLGQDDDPRNAQSEAERTRLGTGAAAPLDPRSYTAKPVWQRMIIISAGVVMNLISAVFLAGAAYYVGVPYSPSVVGGVNAGSPAWIAGMQPGDQILRVGSDNEDDPYLRFTDLTGGVVMHGFKDRGQPLELNIARNGSQLTLNPTPSSRYDPSGKLYLLGFTGAQTTVLGPEPVGALSYLADKQLDLQPGDRIVAVDGQELPVDSRFGKILSFELQRKMQARWNQPVALTIERQADQSGKAQAADVPRLEVTVPPVPRNGLGIGFQIGAVTAVRPDSPGEAAGFMVGDVIQAVDGQALVDSLRLPQLFASKAGSKVVFTVLRGTQEASSQVELSIDSPSTPSFDNVSPNGSGELSLGGIGVAFEVSPLVSHVDSSLITDGSVQVGDRLLQYRWSPTEDEIKEANKKFVVKYMTEPRTVDGYNNVVSLDDLIQKLPAGTKFDCDFERAGKTVSAVLKLQYTADSFRTDERGLETSPLMSTHQTTQLASAMGLGLWETKRRFFEVIGFLRLLFTGRIGMGGIAGPVRLVDYAAQEASNGTSRLLLFLTMLSANLAILNFLPIPALDGGHMVFLTYEAIRRKPVNEELQIKLTMAGVLGLLTLMAFVILKDIYSYIS